MVNAEHRPVGEEFQKMAENRVVFVSHAGDRTDLPALGLTPTDQLEVCIPAVIQGTIYAHFQATDDTETSVRFVHPAPSPELRRQACREAALGMMDNPHFR
jgi:hypothetical protein